MKKTLLVILLILFAPAGLPAADFSVDLGIAADDIFFNVSEPLTSGDRVRLYARVHNFGKTDVEGYVLFYQGSIPIGRSQVISVRAKGVPEEVFVDFTVPSGTFNIRADIKGTDPPDENPANDSALTKLFEPILPPQPKESEPENTPAAENPDSSVSQSAPPSVSESNSGQAAQVSDASSAKPKSVDENENLENFIGNLAIGLDLSLAAQAAAEGENFVVDDFNFSPQAIFSYERRAWNKFAFKAVVPEISGYHFEWNFGDNVSSSKANPEHEYRAAGDFRVSLRIVGPEGLVSEDSTIVSVPFFSLHNPFILMMVGLLGLVLLLGLMLAARLSFLPKRRSAPVLVSEAPPPIQPEITHEKTRSPVRQIRVRDGNSDD